MSPAVLLAPSIAEAAAAPAIDLTPLIPVVVTAVLGLITALIINASKDRAARIPTMAQVWARMDAFENDLEEARARVFTLKRVFLGYVNRVHNGGSNELTEEEREALVDKPSDK
jgi:hypothetical protein